MKGGMRRRVTSRPLSRPHSVPTRRPTGNPTATGQPMATDSRPMTIDASTITMPTERSMPAVRMISV